MTPVAATVLLREAAPPLPADVPSYTLSLAFEPGGVRGEGTVAVPALDVPLGEASFLLHGNDHGAPTTRVTRVEVVGRRTTVDASAQELRVRVEPPVPPGETLTVSFSWEVALRTQPPGVDDVWAQGLLQLQGQGDGDYGLQARGDGIAVLAGGYPMLAPRVDGRFAPRVLRPDAPIGDLSWNGPARWDVTLTPAPGETLVTNLVDEPGPDGTVRARGEGPWDLVVVAYADPVVRTATVNGVTLRSWSRRGDEATAEAVLAEAGRALRFLERYHPYPYRELDLAEAALSGGAGGVEFGGMALIASFLYRSPRASPLGGLLSGFGVGPDLEELRAFVVAHEVAHQWSPGMLVADAWAQPIVDEPLAQYLAWRVLAGGAPDGDALFARQVTSGYAGMRLMGGSDGPAARETTAFPDGLTYGGLIYGKAPHLYRDLEGQVGRVALDRALADAFASRTWTPVDGRGWLALLEAHGAPGAAALGDRWWWGATADQDLGLDPDGHAALRMLLGPQAATFESLLASLGLTPAAYFASFGGALR